MSFSHQNWLWSLKSLKSELFLMDILLHMWVGSLDCFMWRWGWVLGKCTRAPSAENVKLKEKPEMVQEPSALQERKHTAPLVAATE